jgi:hypothetical protein
MNNPTIQLTIYAGQDGGLICYETVLDTEYGTPDSRLVFGGNLDEASKYLTGRMAGMLDGKSEPQETPRQLEAPVKIRVRRAKEPQPVDVLEALEMAEDVG